MKLMQKNQAQLVHRQSNLKDVNTIEFIFNRNEMIPVTKEI